MNEKLSRSPKNLRVKYLSPKLGLTAEAWRYEERGGILVIVRLADKVGRFIGTAQVLVGNRVIKDFLRRSAR